LFRLLENFFDIPLRLRPARSACMGAAFTLLTSPSKNQHNTLSGETEMVPACLSGIRPTVDIFAIIDLLGLGDQTKRFNVDTRIGRSRVRPRAD
jgi:hypothetical protein